MIALIFKSANSSSTEVLWLSRVLISIVCVDYEKPVISMDWLSRMLAFLWLYSALATFEFEVRVNGKGDGHNFLNDLLCLQHLQILLKEWFKH